MLRADISIGRLFQRSVYVDFYPRVIADSLSIYRARVIIGFYRVGEREHTREKCWLDRETL